MPLNFNELRNFRHVLHANPEVSGNEVETSRRVLEFLKTCKPDELTGGIGGHGILASWKGTAPGKEIVFRAELDALPIREINTFGHKSKVNGVSHKCGHDGHATVLCGLAQHIDENRPAQGTIRLLFQPAEENGEGAKAMLEDKIMKAIHPDYIFAFHNLPGYPLHRVVMRENTFTASVTSIIIHLEGKTSHAAEPEHGHNPAIAVADILKASIALENNKPQRQDMRVITPVYMEMGEKAYGISAGSASVHLTIRCWNDKMLNDLQDEIETAALKIGKQHKLDVTFSYTQTFHANVNDPGATEVVRKAASKGGLSVEERDYPFKWGEDFGLFTSIYKGCMFGIGAGEYSPALHNPDYDFPDELIQTGVRVFSGIIDQILNPAEPLCLQHHP